MAWYNPISWFKKADKGLSIVKAADMAVRSNRVLVKEIQTAQRDLGALASKAKAGELQSALLSASGVLLKLKESLIMAQADTDAILKRLPGGQVSDLAKSLGELYQNLGIAVSSLAALVDSASKKI